MAFQPTPEQKLAIDEKGSIIVSAAAGSGKTAVLVERVAKLLTDKTDPVYADKLLVVTFTNAAAAELRSRIEKRLSAEFDKAPDDMHLQRQRILINSAKICTIDSFCIDFIKENFERAGIAPSFKIADNATLHSLERTALSSVISECFDSGDEDFLSLLQFLGEDYDDSKLQKCIYQIFDFSRHMPFPQLWLSGILQKYKAHADGSDNEWFALALEAVKDMAEDALLQFRQAMEYLELAPAALEKYCENYNYYLEYTQYITELCKAGDWDGVFEKLLSLSPPKCRNLSADEKTEAVQASVKLRDLGKRSLEKIKKTVYGTRATLAEEIAYILPFAEKIVNLVQAFEEKLYDLLSKQGIITFYIAEQTVLDMLAEVKDGRIVRREEADAFSESYDAILVDEYQDTNTLQDTLFNILSDGGKNLFCVGDMKQCIYKFRGSNPLNFLSKKQSACDDASKRKDGETLRVDLGCNFRSRSQICDFINSVFEKILYCENSGFDYDEHEKLIPMAKYPENDDAKVETHFIDYGSLCKNSDIEFEAKIYAEAEVAANIILDTVGKEPFLRDGEGLRKAGFGDITVLVRSMRDKGDIFIRVFKEKGIPVSVSSSDVLDSDEAACLIAILKVINNPSDDIALLTAMTSPVFGFSMDELAAMRSGHKYGSFVSSVTAASETGNTKAKNFLETVSRLRRKSIVMSVDLLIDEIFDETNLLNIYSSLQGGDVKRLNLLCIQNIASTFENERSSDLRGFLNYFSELDNRDISLSSEKADSVTVMSIHKSKGLQFPVCILANTSNQFNQQDLRDTVLISEKHGFSAVYYDRDDNKVENTVLRSVMKHEEHKQLLAEELRIFYVALTRAEEKLILLASYNDLDKEVEKKCEQIELTGSESRVEYSLFRKNISYADWILTSLLIDGHKDSILGNSADEHIFVHKNIVASSLEAEPVAEEMPDSDVSDKLRQIYSYKYPYAKLSGLQSKASVTELVHKADDKLFRFTRRPAFMQEKGLNSAEKGTAVHKVMQYAEYDKCTSGLQAELERLHEFMYLSDEEFETMNTDVLNTFFASPLCKRILQSPMVKREMRFITEFPATDLAEGLDPMFSEEMIVVQGAIDLLFEENGKIVIVDFKTDRNKNEEELLDAYTEQLKIYAKACSKILKMTVGELIIYSFSLGKPIIVY